MSVVISDRPYADWLTKSLGYLESQNIQKLAIVGIDEKITKSSPDTLIVRFPIKHAWPPTYRQTLYLTACWLTPIRLSNRRMI